MALNTSKCNHLAPLRFKGTQCAQWSQFMVHYFSRQYDLYFTGLLGHQTLIAKAADTLQQQACCYIYIPWEIKNANLLQIFSTYGRRC